MVVLRREKPPQRGRIAREEAVGQRKARNAAEPEPEEAPAERAETDEQHTPHHGQDQQQRNARSRRARKRKTAGGEEQRGVGTTADAPADSMGDQQQSTQQEERPERVGLRNRREVEVVEVPAEQREDGEPGERTAVRRHELADEGDRAESREETEGKRHHAPAEQTVERRGHAPDRRENGVDERHRRPLRVEEVPVGQLSRPHHLRRVKVPALILVQSPEPHRKDGGTDGQHRGKQPRRVG